MALHLSYRKGLRQGFLLTSLHFLLVVESLGKIPLGAKNNGALKGIIMLEHYICLIFYLLMTFYLLAIAQEQMLKLIEILDMHCLATRMTVNVEKSTISFTRVSEHDQM